MLSGIQLYEPDISEVEGGERLAGHDGAETVVQGERTGGGTLDEDMGGVEPAVQGKRTGGGHVDPDKGGAEPAVQGERTGGGSIDQN